MTYRLICILFLCVGLLSGNLRTSAQTSSDYDSLVREGNARLQAGNNEQALTTASSAIKLNGDRWEAHALAGGALMNLHRYEEAADNFSDAIKHAPEAKQQGLRDLRKQCLLAESGVSPNSTGTPGATAPPASTTQAEIVLWKTIENSTNSADFQSYLNQYPHGAFSSLAQRHLNELKEKAVAEQAAAEKASEEKAIEERQTGVWTDPATSLTWAKRDNGSDVNWQQAKEYCRRLSLAGYSDWSLPTIDELQDIYDKKLKDNGYHVKGSLQLSVWKWNQSTSEPQVLLPIASKPHEWEWSSTRGNNSDEAWNFDFYFGSRRSEKDGESKRGRALCVRH